MNQPGICAVVYGERVCHPRAAYNACPAAVATNIWVESFDRAAYLLFVLPGMQLWRTLTGTAGAVILAALAYGISHGYTNTKQFVGSVVSAFLFTLAFVFTKSLWWLMALHVCLPLFAVITGYILLNKAPRSAAA